VHELRADLRNALIANAPALAAWKDITPLARNEFICWVEDAKQETTRKHRIRRTQEELEEGKRRPCESATERPPSTGGLRTCTPSCNNSDNYRPPDPTLVLRDRRWCSPGMWQKLVQA
jgi:bacteriocin resistance YdeI/OmpD-like protein